MYAISTPSPEGETTYWIGGETFSLKPEDAVRFVKELDADATILILTRVWPDAGAVYTVSELPGEPDGAGGPQRD